MFLKKQNRPLSDGTDIGLYETKAKDLINKYSEHDENNKTNGLICYSILSTNILVLFSFY